MNGKWLKEDLAVVLLSEMSVLHSFNFKVKNFAFLHQCITLILHFIIVVGLILVNFSALWMNLKI